MLIMWKDTR